MPHHSAARRLSALLIAISALALAGCNTFEGFGRDVEAAGSKVSETAEETKEKM